MTDSAGNPESAPRQTILIIDDDRGYGGVIAELLEAAGLTALAAYSGEEGLAAARRRRPDLILLDVLMPGIDGYETCRRLKAGADTAGIPVLFMSGQAEIEDKMQGFTAGGLDYIAKPFQSRELLARVRTHLTIQDQARHLQEQTIELGRSHDLLEREVARRVRAEEVLRQAHDELEQRVEERTAALKKSQLELTFKIQELSAINAIAAIIANTSDLGEMLHRVLETTFSLPFLEVQKKGAVFLRDEKDPARLNRVAHIGLTQFLVDNEQQIAVGHCLCGACAATGRTMITTASGIPEHTVQYQGMPNHGHAVLPIKLQERVLGVMTMYLEPGVQPDESEVRLLEAIASQVGLAVENRRLFQSVVVGKNEWEQTFDAIADLVTINAPDHTVLRLNSAAARVFGGYQSSIGRKFYELAGDERFAESCRLSPDICTVPGLATIRGREYETYFYPLAEQGGPRGGVFVAKDVTERNLAEKSLREHRAFTDELLRSSSVATFVIDARHEVIIWNKACEELTGFPAQAMIGTTGQWRPFYAARRPVLADIVLDGDPEKEAGLYAAVSRSVLTPEGLQAEGWYDNLNGRTRYLLFDATPIHGGDGAVIAAIETLQDLTERKRAEEEIAESEGRYRQLFENANDMIQSVAPDGRIQYVNPAWLVTLGYEPEDLQTMTLFDVLAPGCSARCREVYAGVIAGQSVDFFEATFVARDGSLISVEGSLTAVVADSRVVSTHGILHNVTERKRLTEMTMEQMRIAEFERDIGAVLNSGESIRNVLTACANAMVRHLDAAFARIWTLDDSKTMLELQASSGMYTHLDGPHGRLPIEKMAKIPLIAATGKPNLTNSIVGDPGITDQEWAIREGMVSFAGYPLIVEERILGVLGMFARRPLSDLVLRALEFVAGNIALGIARARLIEGLEVTVLERTRKIRDANRELRHLNGELELRREEAEAANRTKSDFLANMSHELRTPLNAIIGFSDLMVRGMAGPLYGDQKEYLGDILTSGQHLLSLINDILDLSKIEAGKMEFEPVEIDLADLVASSLTLFREKSLKHGIRLEAHTAAGAVPVRGDERKIRQIVFNLLSNAIKFTPDGGAVVVRATIVQAGGDDHAEIAVSDTGIGMTPEEQQQLFQPFKQLGHHLTKRHEGTGLGLALCKKFVELHHGVITVASVLGRGSTFTVRLPLRYPGPGDDEN